MILKKVDLVTIGIAILIAAVSMVDMGGWIY